jgi:hypothetical protein
VRPPWQWSLRVNEWTIARKNGEVERVSSNCSGSNKTRQGLA